MGSRLHRLIEGWHAHLLYDEGLGWTVLLRGEVLGLEEALTSPVKRIRRLARRAAFRNPDRGGLPPDPVSFIWPQRGSDKGAI